MAIRGPLCVGIDPHPELLRAWGLGNDPAGLRHFALTVVEALGEEVAALKPQAAFFEGHGARGVAVLEELLAAAREAGVLTILDVKRGDIGSTMTGYAEAYLGEHAPLRADAITLSPYLGPASLDPAVELAQRNARGVFLLTLTSNPGGREVQHAMTTRGKAVAASVAEAVTAHNAQTPGQLGSVGMVIGATTGTAVHDLGIDLPASRAPLLAPGIGAQGATGAELGEVFAGAREAVLATTSRDVLCRGPEPRALRQASAVVLGEVRAALHPP